MKQVKKSGKYREPVETIKLSPDLDGSERCLIRYEDGSYILTIQDKDFCSDNFTLIPVPIAAYYLEVIK